MYWKRVLPDYLQKTYDIRMTLNTQQEVRVYLVEFDPMDMIDDWPLVTFQQTTADVVTLSIEMLPMEFMEGEDYDPRPIEGGYLSLDEHLLRGLIDLLYFEADCLPGAGTINEQAFRELSPNEELHHRLIYVPDAAPRCFLYLADPLATDSNQQSLTALRYNTKKHSRETIRMMFSIHYFAEEALNNPQFDVCEDALACIHLDKGGLLSLANLLHQCLEESRQ